MSKLNRKLTESAKDDDLDSLIDCLEKGADVNANHNDALCYAVKNNNLDMVEVLMANGADIDDRKKGFRSALERAVAYERMSILNYFAKIKGDSIHKHIDDLLTVANYAKSSKAEKYITDYVQGARYMYSIKKKYEVSRYG